MSIRGAFFRDAFGICLIIFTFLVHRNHAASNMTYSFRKVTEWGKLSINNAHCCPRGHYSFNNTDKKLQLPDVIGLGVQKGGSTSITLYMSRHESYVESFPKETHFFDEDWKTKTLSSYQKNWANRGNHDSIRFEFTPSYLWVPFSACRIKMALPNIRFIVMLRDPVDRAYSEFTMVRNRCDGDFIQCGWVHQDYYDYIKKGIQYLQDRQCTFNTGVPEKTWNDCFQCLLYNPVFRKYCQYRPYYLSISRLQNTCFFFGEQIISRGLYAAQLAWWFQLFPPKNFLVLNSNEFFSDPLETLARVNAFLGVEKSFNKYQVQGKGMTSDYKFKDPHKPEATALLKTFFERPNQELYALLNEVGLGPFTPFDVAKANAALKKQKEAELHKPTVAVSQQPAKPADSNANLPKTGQATPKAPDSTVNAPETGQVALPKTLIIKKDDNLVQSSQLITKSVELTKLPIAIPTKPGHSFVPVTENTPTSTYSQDTNPFENTASQTSTGSSVWEPLKESSKMESVQTSNVQNPPNIPDVPKQDEKLEFKEEVPLELSPNLLVIGRDVPFHKMHDLDTGRLFPEISRAGYYLCFTVLVIFTILWMTRSRNQGIRSTTLR